MFTHVMVGAHDLAASKKFYDAVLGAIGLPAGQADPKGRIFYRTKTGVFGITKEKVPAHYERSDVCVVPAAGVIGEAMVALTLADAFLEKFGGDSMAEVEHNYRGYMETLAR